MKQTVIKYDTSYVLLTCQNEKREYQYQMHLVVVEEDGGHASFHADNLLPIYHDDFHDKHKELRLRSH